MRVAAVLVLALFSCSSSGNGGTGGGSTAGGSANGGGSSTGGGGTAGGSTGGGGGAGGEAEAGGTGTDAGVWPAYEVRAPCASPVADAGELINSGPFDLVDLTWSGTEGLLTWTRRLTSWQV